MHLNSELLFRKYAVPYFKEGSKVLEIGPAGFPSAYQRIVNDKDIEWHTIDFADSTYIISANQYLTYTLQNPYEFPVEDDMYDIILSGQVIEHVEKIWVWLREVKRITKRNGLIITINPISWPYHEAPVDCWRIFPQGMKSLADECGLLCELSLFESMEMLELRKEDPQAIFIPGKSYNYETSAKLIKKKIRWNKFIRNISRLKSFLEIPIEVSYDAISVLRKI
jgi:ubiquinone/menaquinone biosynthesis C-methylase UbiE